MDLLAIDAEGRLIISELKRGRTPREVIAQVLDYASWIRTQTPRDIDELCRRIHGHSLPDHFRQHFNLELPESACKSHRMLIVAAELDESSERIIHYLQDDHEIDINAVFFSVYWVDAKETTRETLVTGMSVASTALSQPVVVRNIPGLYTN